MPELQISDAVKISGDWANSQDLQRVVLWDIGPERPKIPPKPKGPLKNEPDYDALRVEYEMALEDYRAALIHYNRLKEEHRIWYARNDGPVELTFWSCDAQVALARDAEAIKEERQDKPRYYISSSTRGYERLPNRGLPPDAIKTGRGQAEQERRIREGEADLVAARKADPVFGEQELRQ